MRLLVLSFYFAPDLSAGSFRTTALVDALRALAPPEVSIDVVTTLPNRYRSFSREAAAHESRAGVRIDRIRLPPHSSDLQGQSRAFVHFARAVRTCVAPRPYDLVFATSSRLMTATLGAWIARRKRARLYLDIRDIFADTIGDLLPRGAGWGARALFSAVESWTVRCADRINLVSPGFLGYFRARYGERLYTTFTNGIDAEFLTVQPVPGAACQRAGPVTILYAGNIGEGQSLHTLLPAFAQKLGARARFVVIGDGGRRAALTAALARSGVSNVQLHAPMGRTDLMHAYAAADVLLLHLGKHPAFEKVLPSKVFEYAAMGKPLLAGVAGYAARFIREELSNAAVFTPSDAIGAVAALETLELRDQARPEFVAKYARSQISQAMAADILALAREPNPGLSS